MHASPSAQVPSPHSVAFDVDFLGIDVCIPPHLLTHYHTNSLDGQTPFGCPEHALCVRRVLLTRTSPLLELERGSSFRNDRTFRTTVSSLRCRTLCCKLARLLALLIAPLSLRLFLSPYFSISVAMHYLKTYPESIGISHYLCWRMNSMPADEVEFYWPQIWSVYNVVGPADLLATCS